MKLVHSATVLFGMCLLVAGASADEPKTYKITLLNQSRIAASEFDAGEYKLIVAAPTVQLQHRNGSAIDVKAKIETADAKYDNTAITTKIVNGVRQIVEIRIGGSKTKLTFDSN